MKLTATKYFQNAGYVDAIRGNTLAHIATLPEYARAAYARGQALAQPKVYTYKLNRAVGDFKSGAMFTRSTKIPQDAKGKVQVSFGFEQIEIPVSRLILV